MIIINDNYNCASYNYFSALFMNCFTSQASETSTSVHNLLNRYKEYNQNMGKTTYNLTHVRK